MCLRACSSCVSLDFSLVSLCSVEEVLFRQSELISFGGLYQRHVVLKKERIFILFSIKVCAQAHAKGNFLPRALLRFNLVGPIVSMRVC